jgi:hypothetical protein
MSNQYSLTFECLEQRHRLPPTYHHFVSPIIKHSSSCLITINEALLLLLFSSINLLILLKFIPRTTQNFIAFNFNIRLTGSSLVFGCIRNTGQGLIDPGRLILKRSFLSIMHKWMGENK